MKSVSIYLVGLFACMQINSSYAKTHIVLVSSNVYTPSTLVIEAGDTVRWINTGGEHNIQADDNSFRCAQGCDATGGDGSPSTELWNAEITFRTIGTTTYYCDPHLIFGMVGSITVIEPTSVTVHEVRATTANSFEPADLTIQRGDIIRFINDGGEHNINSVDGILICSEGCVGDGINDADTDPTGFPWDIYVRFDQVAETPYFCQAHESTGSQGIIRVTDTLFFDGFEQN
ncbi:MAG: plastocyanin/azurin family copper-binding protein [Proteobacteria bacterium]|nr:plastocyanin/azurin family copper-binding protein [Pseudomonadota bacterium]